jgi:hypothetical protein
LTFASIPTPERLKEGLLHLHTYTALPVSNPTSLPPLQAKQLASVAAKLAKRLPDDIDYAAIQTLSLEAREKLNK